MKVIKGYSLYEDGGNGRYTIFQSEDFEYINPIEYYKAAFVQTTIAMMRDLVTAKMPSLPPDMRENLLLKQTLKEWEKTEAELMQTLMPQNLISLLNSERKKEQVRLLKGLSVTPIQLRAFFVKAWTDFGFSYSQYTGEYHHKGLDLNDLPALTEIFDDEVIKVGSTPLSDGQLRQAISHRKRTIAKFLDKENTWHCFFITYDSLKGEEAWKDGQPHYHYISDKFGIPRENVVRSLKSSKYQLNTLPHIDLLDENEDA